MPEEKPFLPNDISVFDYPLPEKTVDRKTRDSVFTDLFHRPKYALELYKVLHPEETEVKEQDITAVTLKNVFASGQYNDLGMMVGDRLIILVESQTSWSPNMALRCLLYIADTYTRYISKNQIDVFRKKLINLPRPEFYVVYTGPEKNHPAVMKLTDHFTEAEQHKGVDDEPLQLQVKMLYTSEDGDILKQYFEYCRIFTQEAARCNGDRMTAVKNTIQICENAGILSEYIREHEPEVQDNMIACLQDDDYIMKIHILNLERDAREEGLQQGLQEGLQEGLQRGRQEGVQQGLQEGRAESKALLAEKDALIAELRAQLEKQK